MGISSLGAKQHPPPSHFRIIPSRDYIRPRPKNQMEVIRQNGIAKKIDPKVLCEMQHPQTNQGVPMLIEVSDSNIAADLQEKADLYAESGIALGRLTQSTL